MGISTGVDAAGVGLAPAQFHPNIASTVGLWQFDGDIEDETTTADLTVDVGTERYADAAVPKSQALHLDGITRIHSVAPVAAALRVTGDCSWEGLVYPVGFDAVQDPIFFSCGGISSGPDVLAENFLYRSEFGQVANANDPQALWERGAGVNHFLTAVFSVQPGRWSHFAVTRDVSGGVGATIGRIYINGTEVFVSTTLDPPDGGTNARIRVGGIDIAGAFFTGYMSSWRVMTVVRTPAEILADARLTLPPDVRP